MNFLNLVRARASSATLLTAFLATGCATIADPVTLNERASAKALPMKEVLVVLDYQLEAQVRIGIDPEKRLDSVYHPVAEFMADAVTAAGGKPTVVHVRNPAQMPTATGRFSHVWVQRIVRLTKYTMSTGDSAEQRRWRATVAHRPAPGAPLVPAYETEYVADGVICFAVVVGAGKDDCKAKFRAHVNRQLEKYQAGP